MAGKAYELQTHLSLPVSLSLFITFWLDAGDVKSWVGLVASVPDSQYLKGNMSELQG
jgi:hypothetical protein